MIAHTVRYRLSRLHPAFTPEILTVIAVWAGLLWCVAASEDAAMRLRVEAQVYHEVHQLHPELWIVGVIEHGALLDAWGER